MEDMAGGARNETPLQHCPLTPGDAPGGEYTTLQRHNLNEKHNTAEPHPQKYYMKL